MPKCSHPAFAYVPGMPKVQHESPGTVVSVAGTEKFLSVQDRLAKIVLMTDHDVIFDPV